MARWCGDLPAHASEAGDAAGEPSGGAPAPEPASPSGRPIAMRLQLPGMGLTCGSQPAGSAAPGGSHAARVSLTITVDDHAGAPRHWTLRCDPPGGTHPDAAAACRVLLHAKNPFGAIPKGMMCPMIAADAKTATVKGTFFGRHIDTTFTEGGCQLLRWAKIGQIFS